MPGHRLVRQRWARPKGRPGETRAVPRREPREVRSYDRLRRLLGELPPWSYAEENARYKCRVPPGHRAMESTCRRWHWRCSTTQRNTRTHVALVRRHRAANPATCTGPALRRRPVALVRRHRAANPATATRLLSRYRHATQHRKSPLRIHSHRIRALPIGKTAISRTAHLGVNRRR
jgi:hypothetical protein